jgi:hypothetical protein
MRVAQADTAILLKSMYLELDACYLEQDGAVREGNSQKIFSRTVALRAGGYGYSGRFCVRPLRMASWGRTGHRSDNGRGVCAGRAVVG